MYLGKSYNKNEKENMKILKKSKKIFVFIAIII